MRDCMQLRVSDRGADEYKKIAEVYMRGRSTCRGWYVRCCRGAFVRVGLRRGCVHEWSRMGK